MKLIYLLLIILNLPFLVNAQVGHTPNEVIVQFSSPSDLRMVLYEYRNQNLSIKKQIHGLLYLLSFEEVANEDAFLKELKNNKRVGVAQFNRYVQYRVEPNDTLFDQQWALNNDGTVNGIEGADISAIEAWDISTGDTTTDGDTITLAVIDEGFKEHEDINYFINYDEIPNNEIDDDSNGYVDDRMGWNVLNDIPEHVNDSENHGTHISGIISAKTNNETGTSGICWNAKVLPISKGKTVTESLVLEGYAYALKMRKMYNESNGEKGAFVVATNSSFGIDRAMPEDYEIWCNFYDTLGKAGILSAGATANSSVNVDNVGDIPTTCPSKYFIGVTNATYDNMKHSKAGYGPVNIDLSAPGTGILSTISTGSYSKKSGTSMATPHVVGAIGLMYSSACSVFTEYSKQYPDSAALHVRNVLLRSVDVLDDLKAKVASNGRLNLFYSARNMTCDYLNIGVTNYAEKENKVFNFYPNPSSGIIQFEHLKGIEQLLIYNSIGQLTESIYINSKSHHITIKKNGLYHLKIIQSNGEHYSKSIVVIKE